jgi:hypothetical protein
MSVITDFIGWFLALIASIFGSGDTPDVDPTPTPDDKDPAYEYLKEQLRKAYFNADAMTLRSTMKSVLPDGKTVKIGFIATMPGELGREHIFTVAMTATKDASGAVAYDITQAGCDGRGILGTTPPATTNPEDSVVDGGKN